MAISMKNKFFISIFNFKDKLIKNLLCEQLSQILDENDLWYGLLYVLLLQDYAR